MFFIFKLRNLNAGEELELDMVNPETFEGSCHCGTVKFEVTMHDGLANPRRCNCSLCRRKGAVMETLTTNNFRLIAGAESLSLYQWNTKTAKHYFCKICGIYTHHQRRIDANQFGFNVGCLENVDPLSFDDIEIVDGASGSVVEAD